MKTLVIGYGSIGSRHVQILRNLGVKVAVVTQQKLEHIPTYTSISTGLHNEKPDYIVVANRTDKHYEALLEISRSKFEGIILIEKPLFHFIRKIPNNNFKNIFVGYNLRFHPIIQKLKDILKEEKIISVQAYVGQYLPQWRPHRNYRLNYSAKKNNGGGVLRDLSHELDYLNWIMGGWNSIVAFGGKYSNLEIDSDDTYSILLSTKKCPIVHVQMNYLDRVGRREIIVNTNDITIKIDLITNILKINNETYDYIVEKDQTYYWQHEAILNGNFDNLCKLNEGLDVLKIIAAAEKSSMQRSWLVNE